MPDDANPFRPPQADVSDSVPGGMVGEVMIRGSVEPHDFRRFHRNIGCLVSAGILLLLLAVILILLGFGSFRAEEPLLLMFWSLLIVGVPGSALLFWIVRHVTATHRYLKAFPTLVGPLEGSLSAEQLQIRKQHSFSVFPLTQLTGVRISSSQVAITTSANRHPIILLPSRIFTDFPAAKAILKNAAMTQRQVPLTWVDPRCVEPLETPLVPPSGSIPFAGSLLVSDLYETPIAKEFTRQKRYWLASAVFLLVVLFGCFLANHLVLDLSISTSLPLDLFLLSGAAFLGFSYQKGWVNTIKPWSEPERCVMSVQGWVDEDGVFAATPIASTSYRWSAFASCGRFGDVVWLALPGTFRQRVFLVRRHFGSESHWDRATALIRQNIPDETELSF